MADRIHLAYRRVVFWLASALHRALPCRPTVALLLRATALHLLALEAVYPDLAAAHARDLLQALGDGERGGAT